MLPIVLTSQALRIGVAGAGEALRRRLETLSRSGLAPAVFDTREPSREELAGLDLLFVAGLDESSARELGKAARQVGVLVNVEDLPKLCDFHVPAQLRRGDLLITVSTGGRSPGLAARVGARLEEIFGPEWEARLDEIALARARWRSDGLAPRDVGALTRGFVDGKGWLG